MYKKVQYEIYESVNRCLSAENSSYAITTDIWSSRSLDSYMSVTIHYTDGYDRKLAILRCFPYNTAHSAASIKAQMKRIISDWNLPPQPVAVVRDGASNVTKALSDMNGVSCFPHTLARVVLHSTLAQSGVKLLKSKSKTLIKRLRTPKGKQILTESQRINHRKPRSLLQSNKTRWNSTYAMFERLNDEKSVVTLAQAHTELQLAPAQQMSPSDWDLTSKSLKILKPFVEVTKEAEGDHALLSEVIPMVNMLKSEINRINEIGIGKLKSEVLAQLNKYFVDGNWRSYPTIEEDEIYSKATLLDPRFKMNGFKDKTLAMMAKMNVIQEVTKTLMSLKGGSLEGKADVIDVDPIAEDKGTVLRIL